MEKKVIFVTTTQWSWPNINGFTLRGIEILKQLSKEWKIVFSAPILLDNRYEVVALEPIEFLERRSLSVEINNFGIEPSVDPAVQFKDTCAVIEQYHPEAIFYWGGYGCHMFNLLNTIDSPPVICDLVDSWTLTHMRDLIKGKNLKDYLRIARNVFVSASWERKVIRTADLTLTVGQSDASVLRWISGNKSHKVCILPNGVPDKEARLEDDMSKNPTVVFTGLMDYEPNIDATLFFTDKVFPNIKKIIKNAEFIIAGRRPTKEVRELVKIEGVTIKDEIPDMFEFLKSAWISVAPMRIGSGVKNKVLEAWSVGVPVVMNSVGSNGLLSYPDEIKSLIVDDPIKMAEKITQLLSNKSAIYNIGKKSYNHIRQVQSWDIIGDKLISEVNRIISEADLSIKQ